MGIFISRLLPVVRHLIGIPAGIVRMNYLKFSIYTLLGSAVWCSVLCYVGVKAGQEVVTSGVFKLRTSAAITVNNAVQPSASANPTTGNN